MILEGDLISKGLTAPYKYANSKFHTFKGIVALFVYSFRLSLYPVKMPRRSSGGRPAPRPAAHTPLRKPPQPVARAPPPAPIQSGSGSVVGGLGSTIAEGMAFGTGSAIARRAVDSLMGPHVIQHETVVSSTSAAPTPATNSIVGSDACGSHAKAFQDCLNSSGSDISKCQFYMDMLSECRRRNSSATLSA